MTRTAHNHYSSRYSFLYDKGWHDIAPSWWELSEADVAAQPEKFATAYRESVQDAQKLGSLIGTLQFQCVVLAAILFTVSCIGRSAARRCQRVEEGIAQQSAGGNATEPRASTH